MYRLPLFDHRVLDLAAGEGAYAGRLLGDMGAEVIKIEAPSGDPLRGLHPEVFERLNANKYGCVLDARSEEGRRRLVKLAKVSDVVIAPSGLVGFSEVMAANDQLIAVHLPEAAGITMALAAAGAVGVALWDRRRTGRGGEVTVSGPESGRAGSTGATPRVELVASVRGEMELPATPWLLSETPLHIRLPAPGLGEHDDYVFSQLLGER